MIELTDLPLFLRPVDVARRLELANGGLAQLLDRYPDAMPAPDARVANAKAVGGYSPLWRADRMHEWYDLRDRWRAGQLTARPVAEQRLTRNPHPTSPVCPECQRQVRVKAGPDGPVFYRHWSDPMAPIGRRDRCQLSDELVPQTVTR